MTPTARPSLSVSLSRILLTSLLVLLSVSAARAHLIRHASHLAPTGKGWGVEDARAPFTVVTGNGIDWHGGPVLHGTVNAYYIWYGNWTNGPQPSDSPTSVTLLNALFASGGIGGSGYARINTTYGDNSGNVTGNVALVKSTTDNYSQGTQLSDAKVKTVVANALNSGRLPKDSNGLYFVLTSSDVAETSGFCFIYCAWHTHAAIAGTDIKYAFVGNPDQCPFACEVQTVSPNGDSGADGMANLMAHEGEEMLTDPDLNAWYDSTGAENGDKCAWLFGPVSTTSTGAAYNQTFGSHKWLIQLNWENSRGGGCAQTLGGPFYCY